MTDWRDGALPSKIYKARTGHPNLLARKRIRYTRKGWYHIVGWYADIRIGPYATAHAAYAGGF